MQDLVPAFSVPATYEDFLAQDDSIINQLTGQTSEAGNFLPRLSINYDAEFVNEDDKNAEPITLPRGHWKFPIYVDGIPITVFAKEALFRPFIQVYRYSVYDAEENKNVLVTTMFNDWGNPIVDTEGNEFKAGQYKKKLLSKHPEYDKTLKCERFLYGLTSMVDGKDMNGVAQTVADMPSVWRTRGSGFMPVDEALKSLSKQNRKMFMWPMHLTTSREKNGGTTYFVPVIKFDKEVEFKKEEFELFRNFGEVIRAETETVVNEYKKVITKKKDDKFTKEFSKGSLKNDLDDDLDDFFDGAKKAA